MERLNFQVLRDREGWHVYSPDFTFESLMQTFPTRRAAITDVQMMKLGERIAEVMRADDDE